MRKRNFIIGTFILACAGILSRFIGFFYRIFLSNTLGAAGMGIFQLTVPLQSLMTAICVGGTQTAISKLSASAFALKDHQKAKDYFLIGTLSSFILSILLSLILYQNSAFIALKLLKESQTTPLIQILAFCIPLSTLHICINSYYYAQKKTVFPSIIQLLEQISRVVSTYILYFFFISNNISITPVIAGIGSLISEVIAVILGIIAVKIHLHQSQIYSLKPSEFFNKIHTIITVSFPLTLNRLLITLLGSIEVILIPQSLMASGINRSQALSIYGILSGMALPLILFPSTLTNSVSVMLMPSVTELNTLGHRKQLHYVIRNTYKYIFSLGLLFTAFFFTFGTFTGNILFHNATVGIYIRILSFVCPFLYLNTTLVSILHGLGKMGTCLFHNSISICIRIFFVVYMIPRSGIHGYLYGVILSELIKTCLYTLSLCYFNTQN